MAPAPTAAASARSIPLLALKRTVTVRLEEEVMRTVSSGSRSPAPKQRYAECDGAQRPTTTVHRRELVRSFTVTSEIPDPFFQSAASVLDAGSAAFCPVKTAQAPAATTTFEGEVDAVLASMRAASRCAASQREGFGRLLRLCERDGCEGAARVLERGGAEAVVRAMEAHLPDPAVQREACLVLDSFVARGFGHQARVASAGGIGAIISAMQVHESEAGVQEWAVVALASIVAGNMKNHAAALSAGARYAVEAAVAAHPNSKKIQHWSQVVLAQLNH